MAVGYATLDASSRVIRMRTPTSTHSSWLDSLFCFLSQPLTHTSLAYTRVHHLPVDSRPPWLPPSPSIIASACPSCNILSVVESPSQLPTPLITTMPVTAAVAAPVAHRRSTTTRPYSIHCLSSQQHRPRLLPHGSH